MSVVPESRMLSALVALAVGVVRSGLLVRLDGAVVAGVELVGPFQPT